MNDSGDLVGTGSDLGIPGEEVSQPSVGELLGQADQLRDVLRLEEPKECCEAGVGIRVGTHGVSVACNACHRLTNTWPVESRS